VSQSLSQVYIHLVFSTKNRKPWLRDPEIAAEVHKYLGGTARDLDCQPLVVGGYEDHVHILCSLGRQIEIAVVIRELKRESSKWIKAKFARFNMFQWQTGYGAFSVSPSHVPALRRYIANQAEHHQQESFQDEFRRLLKKYGLECDERYVWD